MVSAGIPHQSPEPHARDPQAGRNRITAGDLFVVVAIGIVAMALGIGLIAQTGFELPISLAVAGGVFLAMIGGHIALRWTDAPGGRNRTGRRRPPEILPDVTADSSKQQASDAGPEDRVAAPEMSAKTTPRKSSRQQPVPATFAKGEGRLQADREAGPTAADDAAVKPEKSPIQSSAEPEKTLATSPPQTDRVDLQDLDFGNYRPRSPAELTTQTVSDVPSDGDGGDNIDDMIKRLADDIEAGRKPVQATDKSLDVTALPTNQEPSTAAAVTTPKTLIAPPPLPAADSAAARPPTMSEAARQLSPAPQPPTPPSASARLAAIADALTDEQMDVFLETINGLEDYRAQHYEVSVRLRLADGNILDNNAYISETRGTGLLPLLEAVKVSSTKRLAVQMMRRGRTGEFFSTVDGEALSDHQFGEDVDTITGGDQALAARLVLAFTQADIRGLTRAQLHSLDTISALGFRFAVEDITDLDMDFEDLARRGFTFAKLDADVFLKGLPIGTTRVPAADICRHLAASGLAVIVGKIGDETARATILGFGAVLGQGTLFGAPSKVRANILRPSEQRAPAM